MFDVRIMGMCYIEIIKCISSDVQDISSQFMKDFLKFKEFMCET